MGAINRPLRIYVGGMMGGSLRLHMYCRYTLRAMITDRNKNITVRST